MDALDILNTGIELVSGSKEQPAGAPPQKSLARSLFDKVMETIGLKNPELAAEAKEASETAEKERGSLFAEVGRSLLLRQFPRLALAWDLYQGVKEAKKVLSGEKQMDSETFKHFLTSVSALIILVPGQWKHLITDVFAESKVFRTLVEYWPGLDGVEIPYLQKYLDMDVPLAGPGGPIRQRILEQKDPQAVMMALRVMHQDIFVTGKLSFDKLKGLLGGDLSAAATVLGGGALLTAATNALEGPRDTASGSPAAGTAMVEAVTAAATGTGSLKNKRLIDLQKAHPEAQVTEMQTNVLELLRKMNVLESAVLVQGEWVKNNDEITLGYTFEGGVYFMIFDEDIASTDITVKNAQGAQIYNSTDKFRFNAEENAAEIIAAMKKNPSNAPTATPAPAATATTAAAPPPPTTSPQPPAAAAPTEHRAA